MTNTCFALNPFCHPERSEGSLNLFEESGIFQNSKKKEVVVVKTATGILFFLFLLFSFSAVAGVLTPPDRTQGPVVPIGTEETVPMAQPKAQTPVATAEEPAGQPITEADQSVPMAPGAEKEKPAPAPKKKAVRDWVPRDEIERHVRQYSGGHPAATVVNTTVVKKETPGHQEVYRVLKKWGVLSAPKLASEIKAVKDRLTKLEAAEINPNVQIYQKRKPRQVQIVDASTASPAKTWWDSILSFLNRWWWIFSIIIVAIGAWFFLHDYFAELKSRGGAGQTDNKRLGQLEKATEETKQSLEEIKKDLPGLVAGEVKTATTNLEGKVERLEKDVYGEEEGVGKKVADALQNSQAALTAADKILAPEGPVFSAIEKKADKTAIEALNLEELTKANAPDEEKIKQTIIKDIEPNFKRLDEAIKAKDNQTKIDIGNEVTKNLNAVVKKYQGDLAAGVEKDAKAAAKSAEWAAGSAKAAQDAADAAEKSAGEAKATADKVEADWREKLQPKLDEILARLDKIQPAPLPEPPVKPADSGRPAKKQKK